MFFTSSFNNIYPNLPAYWALGDRASSITGLGGNVNDTRYFTRPTGYPSMTYSLATQEENFAPNGLSQWNPMLIGVADLTQGLSTDPALIQQGNQMAWNWGYQQGLSIRLSSAVSNLTSIESQISSVLKSDKLTEAQKSKLQAVLDQISRLKEQIQKSAEAGNLKQEDVEAIQGKVVELTKKASETAGTIMKEVQETAEAKDADGATGEASDGTGYSGKVKADTEAAKKQKELNKKAVNICQDIYGGTVGSSFRADYDKVNNGVSQINKENVASVLNTWDKQYAKNGKGLIETLFNQEWCWNDSLDKSAKPGQKIANPGKNNINIIWNIVATLDQRAQELGVKEQLAGQFAVAYDELDDTFVDEKAVQDAVAAIQKAVTEAENKKLSEASNKEISDKQKAEAANKKNKAEQKENAENAKKATEAKALFLSDMREVLKDDKAEISDKVQYKDGEFVIRVDGKNYYGKDYLELANALKEAGYKPEEHLKKAKVNAKA